MRVTDHHHSSRNAPITSEPPITREMPATVDAASTPAFAAGSDGRALGAAAQADAAAVAAAGEALNSTIEEDFWRTSFESEPYYGTGYSFADYWPAYRTGIEGYSRYPGRSFEDIEKQLREHFLGHRGESRLGWVGAGPAVRRAWERLVSANSAAAI
jgi:hypothetical protein